MRWLFLLFTIFCALVHSPAQTAATGDWKTHKTPTRDALHNAFFINERRGWAISHRTGLVLATSDGGANWQIRARLGEGYLEAIFFLDSRRGWIAGADGRLLATADGGETWRQNQNFASDYNFGAIHFFDRKRGFIFGIDPKNRRNLIFATEDGGRSWSDRSNLIAAPFMLTDAIFPVDKNTLFAGGNGFVLVTRDRGATWRAADTKTPGLIRGLFFVDRRNGWAVGHSGLLLRTVDGGESWEKQKSFTGSLLRSVVFAGDSRFGIVVGNADENTDSFWQTEDAGQNWTARKIAPFEAKAFHRAVLTARKIWIFGSDGAVLSRQLRQLK